MGEDVKIRECVPDDLPRMQEIRAAAFAPVFQSFRDIVGEEIAAIDMAASDEEQAEALAGMCEPAADDIVYVAELDGMVVGFVSMTMNAEKFTGEIGLNAVDPEYGGAGIGTQMYDFVLARMKAAGMKLATVGTGGDASHAPARRAYEKAGFGTYIPSHWMYRLL